MDAALQQNCSCAWRTTEVLCFGSCCAAAWLLPGSCMLLHSCDVASTGLRRPQSEVNYKVVSLLHRHDGSITPQL